MRLPVESDYRTASPGCWAVPVIGSVRGEVAVDWSMVCDGEGSDRLGWSFCIRDCWSCRRVVGFERWCVIGGHLSEYLPSSSFLTRPRVSGNDLNYIYEGINVVYVV